MTTPSVLLEAVTDVARIAGDVALRFFKSSLAVDTKGDGSPVTIADRTAEHEAREWIAARFPGDAVLGEEFGFVGAFSLLILYGLILLFLIVAAIRNSDRFSQLLIIGK